MMLGIQRNTAAHSSVLTAENGAIKKKNFIHNHAEINITQKHLQLQTHASIHMHTRSTQKVF